MITQKSTIVAEALGSTKSPDDVFLWTRWERFWVEHQPFLLSKGYKLRSRYNPDWIPSWRQSKKNISDCEDAIHAVVRSYNYSLCCLLASPIGRGSSISTWLTPYVSATISKSSWKKYIPGRTSYLLPPTCPLKRCVMTLVTIQCLFWTSSLFLAMTSMLWSSCLSSTSFTTLLLHVEEKLLRRWGKYCRSVYSFTQKCILIRTDQGIELMHEHRIAHRDACWKNLMMDATKIIPKGFHPQRPYTTTGISADLSWNKRSSVAPIDYFIIDYGLTMWFRDPHARNSALGVCGQDKTVPELSAIVPYDPFKVDIYQLGGVIKTLIEVWPCPFSFYAWLLNSVPKTYSGYLEMFRPLATKMVSKDPTQRPTAPEVVQNFEGIVSMMTARDHRARIKRPCDTLSRRFDLWINCIPNLWSHAVVTGIRTILHLLSSLLLMRHTYPSYPNATLTIPTSVFLTIISDIYLGSHLFGLIRPLSCVTPYLLLYMVPTRN